MEAENFKKILESRLSPDFFDVYEADYARFHAQMNFIEQLAQVQNSSVIVFDF